MNIKNLLLTLILLTGMGNSLMADCSLTDLNIFKSSCVNDKFFVKINFKYQDASECFKVSGNGREYGTFQYSKLPIIIDGLVGDCITDFEFKITDCHNEHCTVSQNIGKVCCQTTDCKIYDLKLENEPCDSNDNFITFLNFRYQNTSRCFRLVINNDLYGEFEYTSLPLKIGPLKGDCQTARLFTVSDCEKPDCKAKIEMDKICCSNECKISDIRIERSDCDSNKMFYAHVAFKAQNVSDSFYIKVNDRLFGKFKYGNGFYKVGPFHGDCVTKYKFLVFDQDDAHCAEDTLWGPVCCGDTTRPCKLYDLRYEKTDCNDLDQFFLYVNFNHSNTSQCFQVYINNDLYGEFSYSSLPNLKLGPFPGDCHTEYKLIIRDCKDPHCAIDAYIGKVCCTTPPDPCKLYELDIAKSDCNADNQFNVTINFISKNASECFNIYVNGHDYGSFKYADLPVQIGPFDGDCKTEYVFLIKDCLIPDCKIGKSIGKVCCPGGDCSITNMKIERSDCDEHGLFYTYLKFDYLNTSHCFKLKINDQPYGVFEYNSLPVKIGPLHGDCVTERVFTVYDCDKPDCTARIGMDKICCDSFNTDCRLYDLSMERTECDDNDEFKVKINFKYSNTSKCFRVKGNGHDYGVFEYANLPITIGPLKGDCTTNYGFLIQDCENERCAIDKGIGVVCCDQNAECRLGDLKIERSDCYGDKQFYVFLNFKYTGVSHCFKVRGNGHDYGVWEYNQLPIKIGPLVGDCVTNYEFEIQDCEKHDCHIGGELGKVCCDRTNSKIFEVEMTRSDCEPDSSFKVKFNFHYKEVSDSFQIRVNNHPFGMFAYSQLPVNVGPLLADCRSLYKFHIIDQKDTTIRVERVIEKPCCHPSVDECKIYEVKATPLHCTGPGEYSLMLNFRHRGTTNSNFEVYDRKGLIGYFSFAQLPVTIPNFKKSGYDFDFVKICENDNPRCCTPVEFRSILCDSFTNDPDRFRIGDLIVNSNNTNNRIVIFSQTIIPDDLEIEIFNLEGRQLQVELMDIEKQPHEIFISTNQLMTDLYFIRIKSEESTKTFKFFHIR